MDSKKIQNFFQLGNLLGKMIDKELETPQGQALQHEYSELRKEYDEWRKIVNDPEKFQEFQKQMEIDKALGIIANALNAYLSSPLPKPVGNDVYQAAFEALVSEVQSKKEESQEDEQKDKS